MGKYSRHIGYASFIEDDTPKAISPGKGATADNIIKDYLMGKPLSEIEEHYQVSRGQIYSHLNAKEIPLRNNNKKLLERLEKFSTEDVQNILKDYEDGYTFNYIVNKYDIHKNGLYYLLDLHNIERRLLRKVVD